MISIQKMDSKVKNIESIWGLKLGGGWIFYHLLFGRGSFKENLSCHARKVSSIVTTYKSFREADLSQGVHRLVNRISVQYKGQHTSRISHRDCWYKRVSWGWTKIDTFHNILPLLQTSATSFWFLSLLFQTSEVPVFNLLCLFFSIWLLVNIALSYLKSSLVSLLL